MWSLARGDGSRYGDPVTAAEMAEFAPGLDTAGHVFEWLDEGSLDPNDVREALPPAFLAAGGTLLEETEMLSVESGAAGWWCGRRGKRISAGMFVNCCGAWAGDAGARAGTAAGGAGEGADGESAVRAGAVALRGARAGDLPGAARRWPGDDRRDD